MDLIITSGVQNPAEFIANFPQSITLNEDYEMAVKSIFTAPYFNFTEENNTFSIAVVGDSTDTPDLLPSLPGIEDETGGSLIRNKRILKASQIIDIELKFEIPTGHYPTTCNVVAAMQKVLSEAVDSDESPLNIKPKFVISDGRVKLHYHKRGTKTVKKKPGEIHFIVEANPQRGSVLNSLGYCPANEDELVENIDLDVYAINNPRMEAFLYSTVVTNSMIDQQASRILCVFPVGGETGYNYHEFINPIYRPLSVHFITSMEFAMSNVEGDLLDLDKSHLARQGFTKSFPTILNIHIRRRTL